MVGDTGKFNPLGELPAMEPPVYAVHHLIIFPVDTPLKLDEPLEQYEEGVAVAVGDVIGITATETDILIALTQGL
jgi:hypothetical protein